MSDAALSLSEFDLINLYAKHGGSPSEHQEIVLVAPNKKIKKLWEKAYPNVKVILKIDHRGFPIPAPSKQEE